VPQPQARRSRRVPPAVRHPAHHLREHALIGQPRSSHF
jgi:hypothetical protein